MRPFTCTLGIEKHMRYPLAFNQKIALMGVLTFTLLACQDIAPAPTDIIHESINTPLSEVFRIEGIPHAQLSGNVVPQRYRIDLRMDPDAVGFSGVVEIDVDIQKPTDKIWLHGKDMTVTSALAINADTETVLNFTELAPFEAPSGISYLTSNTVLPAGATTLKLVYETPYNQALNSAYQVKRGNEGYIITQFEPLGAREAFPSFDEPKFKVPFTLTITAPKDDVVYANTPEVKVTALDGGWIKHDFATTRPLPTYLVAFGVGPFDVVDFGDISPNEVRKRPLALRGMAAKGEGIRMTYGLSNTDGILSALESYFGSEYPYEKLDLIAAPNYAFGAMENPGAIVYRESLMLLDTDAPLSQKRAYARVHAHELAHQWFGDLVTPVWWEDIWLNEAFATWMGNKSLTMWKPEGNYENTTLNASLGAMNIDTLSTTRKVREPLARSENVMDQFDGITYRKGGGVLSMFESFVGEEKFRNGVRLHMERYADGVATGDDFFQSIADGSGNADVVSAMKSFVDQPGLPLVTGGMQCVTDGVETEGHSELDFFQSRYAPLGSKTKQGQSWLIPVCAKFGYGDETVKQCTLMKQGRATIIPNHESGKCADWMTLNADGAGYYRFNMASHEWATLLAHLEKLNTREVLTVQDSLLAAYRAGKVKSTVYLKGIEAFAKHPEYEVASNAGALLGFMAELDTDEDLARLVQDMYGARYAANVGKDTVEGSLLVPTLAANLITHGNDKALAKDFGLRGALYLGLNGKTSKSVVETNLLRLALGEAMKTQGSKAFDPLLSLIKRGSPFEKGAALSALTSTTDINIAANLRGMALAEESPFTGRQSNTIISGLLRSDTHEEATWEWLKENFEVFVTRKVPDVRLGGMPSFANGFCSTARRDEIEIFFKSHANIIPGYERSLAQTLEAIELCSALKSAKAEELKKALKAR